MKMKIKNSRRDGFSLVELLVVITIIAILSVTAYVALGGQTEKARNSRRMQDLTTIQSALEIYALANSGRYPATGDLATTLVPNYLTKLLDDPSKDIGGNPIPYKYEAEPVGRKSYQLGTIIEDQELANPLKIKAYIVGNGTGLITGVETADGSTLCFPADGSTACVPYKL